MKIANKRKFRLRLIEIMILVATILITTISIAYTNEARINQAIGGECLIPIIGLIAVLNLEDYKK